jgi:hypothetical protein
MKQISCICEQIPNANLCRKTHAVEITVKSGIVFNCFEVLRNNVQNYEWGDRKIHGINYV